MEEKILKLLNMGMSIPSIVDTLGCSSYLVEKVRREYGFTKKAETPITKKFFPKELLDEWDAVTAELRRCFNK